MSNRLIELQWTPVTDTNVVGYNVYKVDGAPPNSTKTLLAYIVGVTSKVYDWTGVEGVQYQFEIRATDGVNEGPPLEVFYPDGSTIYTPSVVTPTGQPMMIARDTQYLTKDDFINYPNGLKLKTTSDLYLSGALDTILKASSEQVNRYCRRHFNVQTVDEVYHGIRIGQDMPKLVTIPLNEGPIQNINRIDIQVLKWFINFSLDYLQIFPDQGYIQIVPFLGGNASGIPLPSAALISGLLGKIWVNYTFGYDSLPNEILMATSLFATKMIGLQENPVSAAAVKFGRNFNLQWDADNDPLIGQARRLLDPYRFSVWRRP